jgi:hypothetical protein
MLVRMMTRARSLPLLTIALLVATAGPVAAQVATLATPGPDDGASPAPAEAVDEQQAILDFVACLNDNGLELPDPQFGPEGPRFADPTVLLRIDIRSAEFLDAMEACADLLAALQPDVDPELQAEQIEQQLAFAECMRREGMDFPDPDPIRGFDIGSLRGPDGELAFDPFTPDFQAASSVCVAEIGVDLPGSGPATP